MTDADAKASGVSPNLHQFQERNGSAICLAGMPTFQIHVLNSDFDSHNDIDAPDFEAARRQALRSALEIGTDEVCNGTPYFGARSELTLTAG